MSEQIIQVKLKAKDEAEASRVQKAFETMIKQIGPKGIIKMEQLFLSDPLIRNMVKLKLAVK